jgi:RNA polymerase sigma-70 factor (ECF subfamily)
VGISSNSTETDHLLSRAGRGDQAAIESLLERYQAYLRRLIELRMDPALRNRVDVSDVVQETHLEVSRRLVQFCDQRPVSYRLWLRRKALDQLARLRRHHLNTEKRSLARELRLADHSSICLTQNLLGEGPSQIARKREQAAQVQQAVAQLSHDDREILLLRHYEQLTNLEISEVLGITPSAVNKRYGRAARRLCDRLEQLGISASI